MKRIMTGVMVFLVAMTLGMGIGLPAMEKAMAAATAVELKTERETVPAVLTPFKTITITR